MPNLPAALNNDAYAKYPDFDLIPSRCISHMMSNSEIIWKLLKYEKPDAWEQADLTDDEKRELIYKGEDDASKYKVFLDTGISDVFTREDCIIRVSPDDILQETRTVGTVYVQFEVYSHFKVNHLSNLRTRTDMITTELLRIFNGSEILGIGRLNLTRSVNLNSKVHPAGQIPFKGRTLVFGNKSA